MMKFNWNAIKNGCIKIVKFSATVGVTALAVGLSASYIQDLDQETKNLEQSKNNKRD